MERSFSKPKDRLPCDTIVFNLPAYNGKGYSMLIIIRVNKAYLSSTPWYDATPNQLLREDFIFAVADSDPSNEL